MTLWPFVLFFPSSSESSTLSHCLRSSHSPTEQELFNQPHISTHRSGSSPGLFFSAPTLWPCLLLLKAPAGPAGSEDHRGTSLFILCGGPHFSLLSCLFIPALSVWVRVCGPCQQFWPQCMLMASEDVKYSWQGLVCAPQPHLERLFVLNMRLMEQTGYVWQGPSHQWRSKLTVTADDWTKWVFVKVSGSFLCFVDANFNHGARMCMSPKEGFRISA